MIETIAAILFRFITDLVALSSAGGWVFWTLVILAFGIIYSIFTVTGAMTWRETTVLTSQQWRQLFRDWREHLPLIDQVRETIGTIGSTAMQEIEQALFAKARRRIPFAFVLAGLAPLIGLLGTVSGMMATFRGMASDTRTAPIETISSGISEALITTQTGLMIAVPAFVICTFLNSRLKQRELIFRRIEAEILG